ncbi:MAG: hypothetical protein ACTTKY_00240 [Catonella sp.]
MKKKEKIIIAGTILLLVAIIFNSASLSRTIKTIRSDVSGGINRNVKVYSYDGKLIKEYEGKIDIQENENKVLFDLNGKRITIYNSPVVVEER